MKTHYLTNKWQLADVCGAVENVVVTAAGAGTHMVAPVPIPTEVATNVLAEEGTGEAAREGRWRVPPPPGMNVE